MNAPALPLRLRLPATSANLGPGFDAVGLAFSLYLELEAQPADAFSIRALGRDAALVGQLERNLILDTYRALAPDAPPLALQVSNQIPLGMGCGSSAAALVAGVRLAAHFGQLGWSDHEVMEHACRLEGHPDNVAACCLGGFTVSSMRDDIVTAASLGGDLPWRLLLVLPRQSLSTAIARTLLPDVYSRADVIQNTQATASLVAAFALGDPRLLGEGTRDRVHQPYRARACPLLEPLLGLAGSGGVYSATLSGAGPSVLLIADPGADLESIRERIAAAAGDHVAEVIEARIAAGSEYH